jgi:hypothetical protein
MGSNMWNLLRTHAATGFRLSQYFTVNVDSAVGSLKHLELGSISDILQLHTVSFSRVDPKDVPIKLAALPTSTWNKDQRAESTSVYLTITVSLAFHVLFVFIALIF